MWLLLLLLGGQRLCAPVGCVHRHRAELLRYGKTGRGLRLRRVTPLLLLLLLGLELLRNEGT